MSEVQPREERGGQPAKASEFALLRRTRGGSFLLGIWCVLLAVAVIGTAALAPYAWEGDHARVLGLSVRDGVVIASVGGALLALCARIAGARALMGIAGFVLGIGLTLVVVKPAIDAGVQPTLAAWIAALAMTFVTFGLTYGRTAVAVAGTVSMAVILAAATVLAAWVLPIVAPGQPLLIAVAVLSAFGGLCDVAITQVSTVVVAARRVTQGQRNRLREIRRDSMQVGGDHLVSMIHTIGFATLSGPLLVLSKGSTGLGPDIAVALVGAVGLVLATWAVTRLASWTIGGLATDALAAIEADTH